MHGVDDVLHPAGYSLIMADTHRNKQREKEVVLMMVQRGVDGVILLAPQFSSEQSHMLHSYGLPMAIVNNEGAGEYQYLIYNDNLQGITLITRHLIDLGHRQIAYLGNTLGGLTNTERVRGFQRDDDRGRHPSQRRFHPPDQRRHARRRFCRRRSILLSQPKIPTAIMCYNDFMAVGVYRALTQAGYRDSAGCLSDRFRRYQHFRLPASTPDHPAPVQIRSGRRRSENDARSPRPELQPGRQAHPPQAGRPAGPVDPAQIDRAAPQP